MLDKLKDFQILLLGVSIAIGAVFCALIVTSNLSKDNITVTGSAFEIVKSDSASWTFSLEANEPTKLLAYQKIKAQIPEVKKYLIEEGIEETAIDLEAPSSYPVYRNLANGNVSNMIDHFTYSQRVKITSSNVELVKEIAINAQELIEKGINVTDFSQPEYQYSKLSDLKISLLEDATKDAKMRANSMLKSNRNKAGKIKSARMGVFQITPVDSNSVSDYGINDLSTIEKKVTAVANVVFAIK